MNHASHFKNMSYTEVQLYQQFLLAGEGREIMEPFK